MASGAERVKARIVRRIIAKRGREAADGDEDESEGACSKRDEATTTKVHYAFGQYAAKQMAPKQSMLLVNSVVCVDRIGEEECSLCRYFAKFVQNGQCGSTFGALAFRFEYDHQRGELAEDDQRGKVKIAGSTLPVSKAKLVPGLGTVTPSQRNRRVKVDADLLRHTRFGERETTGRSTYNRGLLDSAPVPNDVVVDDYADGADDADELR
ncbi:unnamed protein product [Haemonchus placei]|uniref:Uncharacterized protein n=1 Tax=Haemonchus placei TaxID=6290 RepID=A0A0N4WPK9_HAEPC|nr:unnamed protein product [Haemonchus placei]